jgi:hypothetical protein
MSEGETSVFVGSGVKSLMLLFDVTRGVVPREEIL